jgi:diadenosine tetraphosphate (Ap4A) HIT family hydrolase
MHSKDCLVCKLNKNKNFRVLEASYWLVDRAFDIGLNGLLFLKTKRHIQNIEDLSICESKELGLVISKATKICKERSKAKRVIVMCLGLKDPHVHFWIVPVTDENLKEIKGIYKAVKILADKYR